MQNRPRSFGIRACLLDRLLIKILHRSLKHTDVVFTGDITVQALADTLAVAHLAEDPAVRRGDALDGIQRAVGIEVDIGSSVAFQIHILGSDLAVGCQLADQLL